MPATATNDKALGMIPPAAEVYDRLSVLEGEVKLLKKLLPLAIDADEARQRLREQALQEA